MSANSGRALWKPYESWHGIELRMLKANPVLAGTQTDRKHLLDTRFDDDGPCPGHRISESARESYGSHRVKAWPLFKFRGKEDCHLAYCPKCLEIGYHSWLFQMDWLDQCPVHKVPFDVQTGFPPMLACPPKEVLFNDPTGEIGECSRSIDKGELYNPMPYFSTMTPLAELSELDSTVTPVQMFNPFAGGYTQDTNTCIYACERIFPSMIVALFPEYRKVAIDCHLRLKKYIRVEFDRDDKPDINRFYLTAIGIRCHQIRETVRRRIMSYVVNNSTYNHRECDVLSYRFDECYRREKDYLSIAYHIWSSIVSLGFDTDYRPTKFNGRRLYRQICGTEVPLIPVPMIGYFEGKDHAFRAGRSISRDELLPAGLTYLVYEIDCWCLFRSILAFLTSVNNVLTRGGSKGVTASTLFEAMPSWVFPHEPYSGELAVYIVGDKFVALFPSTYTDVACGDIEIRVDDEELERLADGYK